MNEQMRDLAASALEHAKTAGADECRVSVYVDRCVEISYRERKPENIKEAARRYLSVDVFANRRYSNQSTSDLRPETLKTFITNAVAMTRMLAEDPRRNLPSPKHYEGRSDIDLEICDDAHQKLGPETRHEIVKAIESSCIEKGGVKVVSVTASMRDTAGESVMLASNGFEGYRRSTFYAVGAAMTAQDDGDRRPNGNNFMASVSRRGLPAAREVGEGAAERTLDLLGAVKIKTETLPVIVENRNVPRLLGGFLAGMYGSNVQQKRSFLAGKKGRKVGGRLFTIIDDPLIVGGLGSEHFDDDGITARKRTMVDAGTLAEYWVDWYYSRKLECEPTSGRPGNLIIPPGARSVGEIMKDLGRGVLVTDFIGGNSNSTTGDFSIGVIGQLFDGGRPAQAIAEMNIADNHLKLWAKLAEVGNDPWLYSSYRTPSLVFTDIVISGL